MVFCLQLYGKLKFIDLQWPCLSINTERRPEYVRRNQLILIVRAEFSDKFPVSLRSPIFFRRSWATARARDVSNTSTRTVSYAVAGEKRSKRRGRFKFGLWNPTRRRKTQKAETKTVRLRSSVRANRRVAIVSRREKYRRVQRRRVRRVTRQTFALL